jgi:hypothetical protein
MKMANGFAMVCCLSWAMTLARADDTRSTVEPEQPAPLQANPKSPADHSTLMHPDQLQTVIEVEGTVLSANPTTHMLLAKDLSGKSLTLQTTANTRILDPQNHPLTLADLKAKDHIHLYYDRKDNSVQQVDLLPSVSETILGK